jgi:hypothetical protein
MANHVVRVAPLKTAHITGFANPSASGNTALVAAVPGAAIRVLGVALVNGGTANNIKFQSATTDISALFALGINGGFVLPFNEHGWMQTAIGEALNINLSGATAVGVQISYILVLGDRG